MPKDNEVDEKVMPVAWVERTEGGLTRMWSGDLSAWAHRPANPEPLYSAATVAELRAEVERRRSAQAALSQYASAAEQRADAAERRVGELEADARELRKELEQSQRDYALLANESIYDGNSIGWIASKAKNYGDALLLAWGAVKEVGGTCDGNTPLHEAIRKQLTKADK